MKKIQLRHVAYGIGVLSLIAGYIVLKQADAYFMSSPWMKGEQTAPSTQTSSPEINPRAATAPPSAAPQASAPVATPTPAPQYNSTYVPNYRSTTTYMPQEVTVTPQTYSTSAPKTYTAPTPTWQPKPTSQQCHTWACDGY